MLKKIKRPLYIIAVLLFACVLSSCAKTTTETSVLYFDTLKAKGHAAN